MLLAIGLGFTPWHDLGRAVGIVSAFVHVVILAALLALARPGVVHWVSLTGVDWCRASGDASVWRADK